MVIATRPTVKVFIDRKNELRLLYFHVKAQGKVLIKGRRGLGKSVLALKLLEEVEKEGFVGVYINCLTVTNGRSILEQLEDELKEKIDYRGLNNRESLALFFKIINEKNVRIVVLDEFTNLFRVLGRKKEFGNIENFAAVMRGYIIDTKASIIATSSGLSEVRRLMKKARILSRTFDFVLTLEPFDSENAIKLVDAVANDFNVSIPREIAERIVVVADFVPFYIGALTRSYILYGDLDRAVEMEFSSGTLAEYFLALYDDLSPTQRQIMFHLGYGRKKFEELLRLIGESGVAQALQDLIDRDLVAKIYVSRKNIFYTTKDRTFASWVVYYTRPIYTKKINELLQVTALGFEALVRETLGALTKKIEVKDSLGRKIRLGPFINVSMEKTKLGQIDLVATDPDGNTIIGECYFGETLTKKKLRQVLKYVEIYPKANLIVFYTGGITEDAKEFARTNEIYLIDLPILREIRKHTPLHPF